MTMPASSHPGLPGSERSTNADVGVITEIQPPLLAGIVRYARAPALEVPDAVLEVGERDVDGIPLGDAELGVEADATPSTFALPTFMRVEIW
mgnify:CR=1 FL=1